MQSGKTPPEGFEYVWNNITQCEVLRPIVGFSQKYLTPTTFVPPPPQVQISTTSGKNNSSLRVAQANKNDEFFTQFNDIVKEMKNYTKYFAGKVIYCPCDKAFNLGRSQFVTYFLALFHTLGIKKLICTQYNPNGQGQMQVVDFANHGFKWEYHGEYEDGIKIDESMIDTTILKGNGSFDSNECRELMKECDIVVTNPPFSKFRQFLAQILEYDKKFIIIGNLNALSYKEVFPLVRDNKVWLGMTNPMIFDMPDGTKKKVGNTRWYTNLEHDKRIDGVYLSKTYTPEEYPKFYNFDAINVDKVKNIPKDYYGIMGVPITLIENYNPNQFEIIGLGIAKLGLSCGVKPYEQSHREYRKYVQKKAAVDGDLYMVKDNIVDVPYARILVRLKHG